MQCLIYRSLFSNLGRDKEQERETLYWPQSTVDSACCDVCQPKTCKAGWSDGVFNVKNLKISGSRGYKWNHLTRKPRKRLSKKKWSTGPPKPKAEHAQVKYSRQLSFTKLSVTIFAVSPHSRLTASKFLGPVFHLKPMSTSTWRYIQTPPLACLWTSSQC